MTNDYFNNKRINVKKLLKFGFIENNGKYFFSTDLFEHQFRLDIEIYMGGKINTKIVEVETNEIYTLHLVENISGAFVGQLKEEYENILKKIASECFEKDIFKSDYSKKVIEYVKNRYGDELEYLWEKLSNNAVCRRFDNSKWYLSLLIISKSKLSLKSNEFIEIIDLKEKPEVIESLVDNKKYFPGYHMNKKHWITIILDGSVSIDEICKRIDESYILAKK